MKKRKWYNYVMMCVFIISITSCQNDSFVQVKKQFSANLQHFKNLIMIDSCYSYIGDSLYKSIVIKYNNRERSSRVLSPEDDAFFSKKYTTTSTEMTLLYGKNYIYPGAVLEGNSILDQKFTPIFLSNRNPITVSMSLTHKTEKPTSRIIGNPTFSKLDDYVKEMVVDGNFEQNQKFMFQYRRFSFYDELKSAFGSNIDTKSLFSSRKENSTEMHDRILKSTGMYVKFFQSSFTVNMDIAPLCDGVVKGKTSFEPVYVNSVTYGRFGILVFETDESYEFAEKCIKKEFNRIFQKGSSTLTEDEKAFFENTDFKVLIIGADSDYAVQTFKGYANFLNLICNSTFTEHSYGVPILCSFSYANSHELAEVEFTNQIYLEPLYVKLARDSKIDRDHSSNNYNSSTSVKLAFYKDREKTLPAYPYVDIIFPIDHHLSEIHYFVGSNWPEIKSEQTKNENNRILLRNISYKSELPVGYELSFYESTGKAPGTSKHPEPMYNWDANERIESYSLESSPFYIIIN